MIALAVRCFAFSFTLGSLVSLGVAADDAKKPATDPAIELKVGDKAPTFQAKTDAKRHLEFVGCGRQKLLIPLLLSRRFHPWLHSTGQGLPGLHGQADGEGSRGCRRQWRFRADSRTVQEVPEAQLHPARGCRW